MRSLLPLFLLSVLVVGCAPPRWAEPLCNGKLDTWGRNDQELAPILNSMSDENLLDLAACSMATSHPSRIGFGDHYITGRSSSMAELLLSRIEARDEGLISMGYVSLLREMSYENPEVLSTERRKTALDKCLAIYPPFTDRQGKVHHYCTTFGRQ